MIHQLKAIVGFQEGVTVNADSAKAEAALEESSVDAGKIKVADLELPARVVSALEEAGIKTAAGLARKTATAIKDIEGIGDKAVEEIATALAVHGLTLKSD